MKVHRSTDKAKPSDLKDSQLWTETNPLTDDQIQLGTNRLCTVLKALANGFEVKFEGDLYPLGMSINGSVGSIYAGHVVGDCEVHYLIKRLATVSHEEWESFVLDVALNELRSGAT